jgi:hypothetical protein
MKSIFKLIVLFCGMLPFIGNAQTTLMDQPAQNPSERLQKGPNSTYYQSGFWSFGVAIPIEESDSAQTASSAIWRYGTRGKWRWSNTFAGIWDLGWNRAAYRIEQDSAKNVFGRGQEFDQQKFVWNQLEAGAGIRVNVGKRGNYLGNFIDLGGYGEWGFSVRQQLKQDVNPALKDGATKIKTTFGRLDYINPLNYGLAVRLGVNKLALWTKYRMSDQFKASDSVNEGKKYPELTRLQVGVEVTF